MGRLAIPIRYAIGRVAPPGLFPGAIKGAQPVSFSTSRASKERSNSSTCRVRARAQPHGVHLGASEVIRDRRITINELTGSERAPTLSTAQQSQPIIRPTI